MPSNARRKNRQIIEFIENEIGADIPRDVKKTALAEVDEPLASDGLPSSIDTIGGAPQSAVDVADAIDRIRAALVSVGTDSLLVDSNQALDVSASEIDIDVNSQSLSQLSTNLQQIGGQSQSAEDVAALIASLSQALKTNDTDQLVARITNSAGNEINPATEALEGALKTNDSDELVVRVTDSGGSEVDPLSTADQPLGVDDREGELQNLKVGTEFVASYVAEGVSDTTVALDVVVDNPTGSGTDCYVSPNFSTTGAGRVEYSTDITIDTAGTGLSYVSKRVGSGGTLTPTVEQGGSYTVNGEQISRIIPGEVKGGGPASTTGTESPGEGAVLLEPGQSIKYTVTNISGGTASYGLSLSVIED